MIWKKKKNDLKNLVKIVRSLDMEEEGKCKGIKWYLMIRVEFFCEKEGV